MRDKLISAEALKLYIENMRFCKNCEDNCNNCHMPMQFDEKWERVINEQPQVPFKGIIHARWITDENFFHRCSFCQSTELFKSPFCPNCGAQMTEMKGAEG